MILYWRRSQTLESTVVTNKCIWNILLRLFHTYWIEQTKISLKGDVLFAYNDFKRIEMMNTPNSHACQVLVDVTTLKMARKSVKLQKENPAQCAEEELTSLRRITTKENVLKWKEDIDRASFRATLIAYKIKARISEALCYQEGRPTSM